MKRVFTLRQKKRNLRFFKTRHPSDTQITKTEIIQEELGMAKEKDRERKERDRERKERDTERK